MSEALAAVAPPSPRFTKVYAEGWERVKALVKLKGGPTVADLWFFLVEHCDERNALVVSVETLAAVLGVHRASVMRATRILRDAKALSVVKIGSANAYILNERETWRSAEEHKQFCAFGAKALASFKDNPGLRSRLTQFREQPALPGVGRAL